MAASLELTRHPIARARATTVAGMAVADTTALREVEAIGRVWCVFYTYCSLFQMTEHAMQVAVVDMAVVGLSIRPDHKSSLSFVIMYAVLLTLTGWGGNQQYSHNQGQGTA